MLTVITPTGDRPLAFCLCRRWMEHQLLKPDQWIVVDDGKIPLPNDLPNMQYIRREPKLDDPDFTLSLNLLTAIPYIKGDKIAIIEDDDYYSHDYLSRIAKTLDLWDLTGYKRAKYYHLRAQKYLKFKNEDFASLAETAFRTSILSDFIKEIELQEKFLDVRFWRNSRRNKILHTDDYRSVHVGIKGSPGRDGFGVGYDEKYYEYLVDREYRMLKKWIPNDYKYYLQQIANGINGGEQKNIV
jgi:hypothetical protein